MHKSVISTICETISSAKISSSHIVKHVLKAISIAKPPTPKIPIWDARVVIKHLKFVSPDPTSLYEVSRRTAMLLLLASGRRVHDLTLLHCDANHFVDNSDSITLTPTFGSTTDSRSHCQSDWILSAAPERNIDPIFWVRTLKEISDKSRGQKPNLFITTRGPVKPATPTIIGGWVKKVLYEAGIQASPGSFRSAVSSLNWLEKYHINDILN
nr:uncharacterized protein LOC113399994 [Vanessa tameamea]